MRTKGSVEQHNGKWYVETPESECFGPFADKAEAMAVLHPRRAFWAFGLFWLGVLALVALLSMTAFGQTATQTTPTWFTVIPAASQSATLSISLPAGTTYRFGDIVNDKWTAPVAVSAVTVVSDFDDGLNGDAPDPDPNTPKEFDVQETMAVQTVTITDTRTNPATVTTVTVPALPPPAPPPSATATFTAGTVYPVVLSSIQPVPDSLAAVLLQRIPLSPNLVIQGVLSGFSFKLAINGVTLTCLTGAATPDGTVTLSCD